MARLKITVFRMLLTSAALLMAALLFVNPYRTYASQSYPDIEIRPLHFGFPDKDEPPYIIPIETPDSTNP